METNLYAYLFAIIFFINPQATKGMVSTPTFFCITHLLHME